MNEGLEVQTPALPLRLRETTRFTRIKEDVSCPKSPRVGNTARIRLAITDNVSVADGPLRELNELVGDGAEPRRRVEETTALVERRALAEQPLNETEKLGKTEILRT